MTPRPMAERIEHWPIERLRPYDKNPRTHSDAQVAQIASSIAEFGFTSPILVDSKDGILAGHGRWLAAQKLGLEQVPVIVLDHLSEIQKRAYIIADNRLAESAGWDQDLLAGELAELEADGFDLGLTGFSEEELAEVLGEDAAEATEPEEEIPEAPATPVTQPGDLWVIGEHHRLLCGDCRDPQALACLFEGRQAAVIVTSPPYATQREYDPASGFQPVKPEDYLDWYRAVADNIASVLAPDGSYFLNIKEHAEEGQRHLYVKDLTIAHVRQWGWRFVDELCWRKTDNGVPGGWQNRFKNAWEPIFHFSRQPQIKFRPEAVSHASEDVFGYSPENPKSRSGSGLLGCGPRAEGEGLARPSNVIEAKAEGGQGTHSAPFPRALPEFFIRAFSDPGDVIGDPFLGSGTVLVAAALLGRIGYGTELSPAYCDVVVRRASAALGCTAVLAGTNQTFEELAAERGVPVGPAPVAPRHGREVDPPQERHAVLRPTEAKRRTTAMPEVTSQRLQVAYWPIEKLIPFARNPRTHSEEQINQIAASIREFSWTNPVLIDPVGVIIAGHARVLAARKLQMTEVPVIVLSGLSEEQRRGLVIADNQLAVNAGWDEEMLRLELAELQASDFDLELLGFSDEELEKFLADPDELVDGLTDEDAAPELPESPVSALADVWTLGRHRLVVGDATLVADVDRLMNGEKADLVFTDPPYNVAYEGYTEERLTIDGDRMTADQFREFLGKTFASYRRIVKPEASLYVCHPSSWQREFQNALEAAGFNIRCQIIWAKNTFAWGFGRYKFQHEPIFYAHVAGESDAWYGDKSQSTLWEENKPAANRLHPTMKPVELIERALVNSSRKNNIVVDLFGGSGSTLIACERVGRTARLLELDPRYSDVILRRYLEFSGQQPVLEGANQSFEEVAHERKNVAA